MTEALPAEAPVDVASVHVKNPLAAPRSAETIALALPELERLGIAPKQSVVVDAAGAPVLSQLVDDDGDEIFDSLLFQVDLAPHESKQFALRFGKRTLAAKEVYKVYGRFVRERHDDFAWENDRIARRMYGVGLESWAADPLVSSGIDSWSKRTSRLLINDWYQTDDYHHDSGEGADMYSVGKSRGCGGLGVWLGDNLYVSRNFVQSRVLANGPLRLIFELDYPEWSAGPMRVSETKRITLDAGKQFERHVSALRVSGASGASAPWQVALGIAKHKGSDMKVDPAGHWLQTWEPLEDGSHLGCSVVLPPSATGTLQQVATDYLLTTPADSTGRVTFSSGFAWDRGGHVADAAAWDSEVQAQAEALEQPVTLTLAAESGGMPWSVRACVSRLREDADSKQPGFAFLTASCLRVAARHQHADLLVRAKQVAEQLLTADQGRDPSLGYVLFELYSASDPSERQRYESALRALHSRLAAPKWVEEVATTAPWLASLARATGDAALFDEAVRELELLDAQARDPRTGLLFHGSEGQREVLWARASGWEAMALVDVLEQLPAAHVKRRALLTRLRQLAAALASVQDPLTGTFWQVIDAAKRERNYRESSATALVAYALAKASKLGLLQDSKLDAAGRAAYRGAIEQFVEVDRTGLFELRQTCKDPGTADPAYDQYTNGTVVNDATGVGAWVIASLARE